jgi:hypothetical protein
MSFGAVIPGSAQQPSNPSSRKPANRYITETIQEISNARRSLS